MAFQSFSMLQSKLLFSHLQSVSHWFTSIKVLLLPQATGFYHSVVCSFPHPRLKQKHAPLIMPVGLHLGPLIKAEWRMGAWRTPLITAAGGDSHHLPIAFSCRHHHCHHHPPLQSILLPEHPRAWCHPWVKANNIVYDHAERMNLRQQYGFKWTNRLQPRKVPPFHKCEPHQ